MDPPSYGRGPSGEMWKFEKEIVNLIEACLEILDDEAIFFLINSYTTGFSPIVLENLMRATILNKLDKGKIEAYELLLPASNSDLLLPCGISGRWSND